MKQLDKSEIQLLWNGISGNWKITQPYWFPLMDLKRKDLVSFWLEPFDENLGGNFLKQLFAQRNIEEIYEINEAQYIGFQMEREEFSLSHSNYGESYWFDLNKDWILYLSHENSITLGGIWLIEEVKKNWKNYNNFFWG